MYRKILYNISDVYEDSVSEQLSQPSSLKHYSKLIYVTGEDGLTKYLIKVSDSTNPVTKTKETVLTHANIKKTTETKPLKLLLDNKITCTQYIEYIHNSSKYDTSSNFEAKDRYYSIKYIFSNIKNATAPD